MVDQVSITAVVASPRFHTGLFYFMIDDAQNKKQLRAFMLAKRKKLALPIENNLVSHSEHQIFKNAKIIAAYYPIGDELSPLGLLSKLAGAYGLETCLPVVIAKATPLIFRQWSVGDSLEEGLHKTMQPPANHDVVIPDVVLVPLLAFDKKGGRLGYGGGYYDRTLQSLRAIRVGIAYDEQEVNDVFMETLDQRMDWILTPNRAMQCVR